MATLKSLEQQLRREVAATISPKRLLSKTEYSAGFTNLVRDSGWLVYQDFIIPQLSILLEPLFNSRIQISVLEIGPGPKSVLEYLPLHLRRKIERYVAFEPHELFAAGLEKEICSTQGSEPPFPCLNGPPNIFQIPFALDSNLENNTVNDRKEGNEKFDVILFCHSMYGMNPKSGFVIRALEMLVERPEGGLVVVFYRAGTLDLDDLVCHRTASFPTGVTRVRNDDAILDTFTPFIAGFAMQDMDVNRTIQLKWRKVCRDLGTYEEEYPGHLSFSSPNTMVAFTKQAAALPELLAQGPFLKENLKVKNREACLHRPASIIRPTEVQQVQQCVLWALKHKVSLTVIGGGHSENCLRPNVVGIDMSTFDKIYIVQPGEEGISAESGPLVVVEAGCKTGDIVRKTMAAGLTVPLGTRPSVGAGMWLQGGVGHLARLHGLACDAIIGAVVVGVDSGEVLCVGCVPIRCQPVDAVRPENENDLLWGVKGAGTSFGIVISITFKSYSARIYSIRNWTVQLRDTGDARFKINQFDEIARKSLRNCSVDAFLYWDADQLRLGMAMFESSITTLTFKTPTPTPTLMTAVFGPKDNFKVMDGVSLFDTELYMGMHGGHGGDKTSSFKRCLLLKLVDETINTFVEAIKTRPTPFCYIHLLHSGGAVGDVASDATAFGCRDWDFACVMTGVWPRDQDGTEVARAAVEWVYRNAMELLPLCSGAYGADLGPDPRDIALAARAYGSNLPRLVQLKQKFDPYDVLAHAFPLPKPPIEQRTIILITGESGAGKDYCADIWVSILTTYISPRFTIRAISISDIVKQEYAESTGTNLELLLSDRNYKEKHRPALTSFFRGQVRKRPRLPMEHFLNVVYGSKDVDVLLITGMRDQAPVATLSHLVSDTRLIEVRIEAKKETRRIRRGCRSFDEACDVELNSKDSRNGKEVQEKLEYCPSLIFNNDMIGDKAAKTFAELYLIPLFHEDLQRLGKMVRRVPDFPRTGIDFRHVLDIVQQPGGLALCTTLLRSHFAGDWTKIDAVACCESGGLIFASALAAQVNISLALIRQAGKLPPPIISVLKSDSHISSSASHDSRKGRVEMGRDVIARGASVVVVDDVLATGETLCAVLRLLEKAGAEHISVLVVAEFPVHRGRELLRQRGIGKVNVQSLLVFNGA